MPEKTTQKEHGKKTAPPSEKEVQPEVVIQIPLAELHPFPDHPFQVRDDDSMRETAESVKAYADGFAAKMGGSPIRNTPSLRNPGNRKTLHLIRPYQIRKTRIW